MRETSGPIDTSADDPDGPENTISQDPNPLPQGNAVSRVLARLGLWIVLTLGGSK